MLRGSPLNRCQNNARRIIPAIDDAIPAIAITATKTSVVDFMAVFASGEAQAANS
jgi:hypothetical protein